MNIVNTQMRLPPGLHNALVKAAQKDGRSLNSLVIKFLMQGLDEQSRLDKIEARLKRLEKGA